MNERPDSGMITIRVTPQEHEFVRSAAKQLGVSQSDLLRAALNKLLSDMNSQQPLPIRRDVPFPR
jgi:predicted HicB family RNase H-like nuclease